MDASAPAVDDEPVITGYAALTEFFNKHGYRTARSTLTKMGSPAINTGPPVEGYYGKFPIFKPSRALQWARDRGRQPCVPKAQRAPA
jgi:hypothetical protein